MLQSSAWFQSRVQLMGERPPWTNQHDAAFGSRSRAQAYTEMQDRDRCRKMNVACMVLLLRNGSYGYPGTDGSLWSNYVSYVKVGEPLGRYRLLRRSTTHCLLPAPRIDIRCSAFSPLTLFIPTRGRRGHCASGVRSRGPSYCQR
eukprot:scaffold442_cov268-Pinguiococcus_pyrenoidosus.AAC.15